MRPERGFAITISGRLTLQKQYESGVSHHKAGRLAEAEKIYRQILAAKPNHADALHLLGVVTGQAGQLDAAVTLIRQAIAVSPTNAAYYGSLGNALQDRWQPDDAIGAFRTAIRLRPAFAEAYNNLGNVLRDTGQLDEAIASVREAIRLSPEKTAAHSNLLANLHYDPREDAETIYEEHRRWNERHAEPLKKFIQPHVNNRDPSRRLRVGYVSADFYRHPVGLFMAPLLTHHDPRRVEVFCYSDVRVPDENTARLRQSAHVWRNAAGMADAQLAHGIRADQIDILVDLSLHSAGNRLLAFARKPAPVQVTWLGYPGTTGLTSIDYRLTDPFLDPPETDQFYSEKSVRLPHTFWCYESMHPELQVSGLPAIKNGYVTFGCFNKFAKVTPASLKLWASLLSAIPRSRFVIHSPPGEARARVIERFSESGIEPNRIEFVDKKPLVDYLTQFNRVDVALDPFPYSGGTSTCDALWMGVPTVTLRGRTAVGRGSVSILSNVGLTDWIAETPEQYVSIAVNMAVNLQRLAELRAGLRKRMEQSPVMNAVQFAGEMEVAYRGMWENWCLRGE
jgi:protein O-GlcNAc transferase